MLTRARWRLRFTAMAAITTVLAGTVTAAHADSTASEPVSRWGERHAIAVPEDPDRRGPDLAIIGATTRTADIVALGEAAHGTREITEIKSRHLKHLVARRGFRVIAWEDDWSLGTQVNDYLHGERDDITALVRQMSTAWRNEEVVDLLRWLRRYNDRHHDDVEFVGVEYYATRPLSYDAVEQYVSTYAPDALPRIQEAFALLEPANDDMKTHLDTYWKIPDKEPYVQAAREVVELVTDVEGAPQRVQDLAIHHARQIRSFYVAFSLSWPEIPAYRDARAAENVAWAQGHHDAKVVYWAAGAHVADAPALSVTAPQEPDTVFASAGSYLADWYGDGYVPIGFTFDHGSSLNGEGEPITLPEAAPGWFEAPLADVRRDQFLLHLKWPIHDPAVQDWLDSPLVTRGDPELGVESMMTGGTLREWYDVVVHRQEVTPATALH